VCLSICLFVYLEREQLVGRRADILNGRTEQVRMLRLLSPPTIERAVEAADSNSHFHVYHAGKPNTPLIAWAVGVLNRNPQILYIQQLKICMGTNGQTQNAFSFHSVAGS